MIIRASNSIMIKSIKRTILFFFSFFVEESVRTIITKERHHIFCYLHLPMQWYLLSFDMVPFSRAFICLPYYCWLFRDILTFFSMTYHNELERCMSSNSIAPHVLYESKSFEAYISKREKALHIYTSPPWLEHFRRPPKTCCVCMKTGDLYSSSFRMKARLHRLQNWQQQHGE